MSNFEKSEIYEKALREYQEKIYGEILRPLHVIVIDEDEVYLFYNQGITKDIFEKIKKIYEEDESNFPLHLGYQEPELVTVKFMGIEYKAISLWYDHCDLPQEFKAKL